MWFKQAQLFKLKNAFPYKAEELMQQLELLAFQPCLPNLPISQGWVAPVEVENAPLVHATTDFLMICLQIEEKILPASVVKQKSKEQIKQIETNREHKISSKEKVAITQSIYNELLPKAFTKITKLYAYIDLKNNWLVLNTLNPKKTDSFITFLQRTLEDIQLAQLDLRKISAVMVNWLKNNTHPDSLQIEKAGVFRDPGNKRRTIRFQQHDLSSSSVQAHLKDEFEIAQMEMMWHDQVTFTLKDDFLLQSIKYSDALIELSKENQAETEFARFDADLIIMANTFDGVFGDLLNALQKTEK
jgi:recombination associated protein RdgC